MSAFIVSHGHIQAIVAFALRHRMDVPVAVFPESPTDIHWVKIDGPGDAQRLGTFLFQANLDSMVARYGEKVLAIDKPQPFTFQHVSTSITPVQFIKALHCLEYQSCEVDDWHDTLAYKTIVSLCKCAHRKLPGYEEAAWEIV